MLNSDFRLSSGLIRKCGQQYRLLFLLMGVFLSFLYSQMLFAADPLKGGKLYQSHCLNCHGANGAGEIPNAPDFSRGEKLLQPDNALLETIKSGRGMMPAYRGMFEDDDIRDVIAYLRTLRR